MPPERCANRSCRYRFEVSDRWTVDVFGTILCLGCAVELAALEPEAQEHGPHRISRLSRGSR